jgi:hypothetical protein
MNSGIANYLGNNIRCNILEKHSISGIDKMQHFLFKDIKYKVFCE